MSRPKLHTLSDAERARIYAEIGFLSYMRLWRQEQREAREHDVREADTRGER